MKEKIRKILLWSQKYTKTDMLYLAKGGFWSGLGFSINSILGLLLVVAFANLLPKETYGIYKYIMSLAGALGFLTLTGMNNAVIQAVSKGYEGALKQAIKIQLRWNFLFLIGLSVLGSYYLIKGNDVFSTSLFIIGIISPLATAFNTYGAFLTGKKEFRKLSVYSILSELFRIGLVILVLFLTKNVVLIITLYMISGLLPNIYFYYQVKKLSKSEVENTDEKQSKELFKYGAHLSIVNIFATISQHIDKIVLFQFLGPIQLATYYLARAAPDRIKGLSKNMMNIVFPKLATKNLIELKNTFYRRLFQSLIFGAVLAGIYILLAPFLFKYLFPKYLPSIFYSQLLSLNLILVLPITYFAYMFQSQKLVKPIYQISVTTNIIEITLYIVMGAIWGILGVIFAAILSNLFTILFGLRVWYKETKSLSNGNKKEYPLPKETRPNFIE